MGEGLYKRDGLHLQVGRAINLNWSLSGVDLQQIYNMKGAAKEANEAQCVMNKFNSCDKEYEEKKISQLLIYKC